jgi:hypothetical protein
VLALAGGRVVLEILNEPGAPTGARLDELLAS